MKMPKRIGRAAACAAVLTAGFAALATGCQTAVPVSYTEPARLDMRGINKIGIISNDSETAAEISTGLTGTNLYSIATSAEISEVQQWLRLQRLLRDATETNAASMVKAYDANAMAANATYKGKAVKVSGTVTEIQERAIRLGVGNDSVDVYIEKSEVKKAATLSKGTSVDLVGVCYGLDKPDSRDMGELFSILGGGKHVNVADALFVASEYTGSVDALLILKTDGSTTIETEKQKEAVRKPDGTILKDAAGNTVYKMVENYTKVAIVNVDYELIRVRTGASVGRGTATSGKTPGMPNMDRSKLPSDASVIASARSKTVKKIISDMVPTRRTLSLKLAKTDSTDPNVKTAMNEAKKLVNAKDYANAATAYGKIYAQSKDFAAGYNQAVMTEVAQGTDKAVVLMEEVAKSSNNQEAWSMLNEMRQRNSANQRAAEQMQK